MASNATFKSATRTPERRLLQACFSNNLKSIKNCVVFGSNDTQGKNICFWYEQKAKFLEYQQMGKLRASQLICNSDYHLWGPKKKKKKKRITKK